MPQRITPQRNATGSRASVLLLGTVLTVLSRSALRRNTSRPRTAQRKATQHNGKTGSIMLPVT
ncbi:hypothetical protein [Acetobacter pasteurianus]|nr:hypothetical protein [Acetobacter pasteurianus]